MNLGAIFVANETAIFLLLILLYVSRTKILRRKVEDRIFFFMVLGLMLSCFMEAFSYAIDGMVFPGARILNYIANGYLYSVNLLLPFCLMVYVDLGLYDDFHRIWKYYKPHIFIGLAMFSVTLVNYFVPVCFYITEQNVYERRPFSYFYYVVILFYCITAIVITRRYNKENGARAFFNVNMFLLPILVGGGLQFAFYGLSLAWLASAIGIVGLYMMQQNEAAYIDSLVDTYNRQYLNHVISAWIRRGMKFTGAMIDIDWFKSINDSFGHSEGDNALRSMAIILKKAKRTNEHVFRFAGDEFVILKMSDTPDGLDPYLAEVEKLLEEFNREDRLYKLSLSYGVSFFDSGNVDAFMKEMDHRMYEMKAEHHKLADGVE